MTGRPGPEGSPPVTTTWRSSSLRRWAVAAFTWSVAFGLVNVAWAAGIELGTDKLSPTLVEEFEDRSGVDVAVLVGTGALKVIGGLVPLALGFGLWHGLPRRWLVGLCWLEGAFLALYGLGDIVGGSHRALDGRGDNAVWYAVLWGPAWLLGGILFLGTAWTTRQIR